MGTHRARPRIGEEIDGDVLSAKREQVVARRHEAFLALRGAGEANRLDGLDAERLHGGPRRRHAEPAAVRRRGLGDCRPHLPPAPQPRPGTLTYSGPAPFTGRRRVAVTPRPPTSGSGPPSVRPSRYDNA